MIIDIREIRNIYSDAVYKYLDESEEMKNIYEKIKEAARNRERSIICELTEEQRFMFSKDFKVSIYPMPQIDREYHGFKGTVYCIYGWANDN